VEDVKMQSGRRKVHWLFVLPLAVGFVLISAVGQPQEKPLLRQAVKVIPIRRLCRDESAPSYTGAYCWLSEQEALVLRSTKKGFLWLRCNLKTGRNTPLARLSYLFNKSLSFPAWSVHSSDGQWLLWQGDKRVGDGIHSAVYRSYEYASTLDGKRFVRWLWPGGTECWATDNRHWMSFPVFNYWLRNGASPFQVKVYDTEAPSLVKVFPLAKRNALFDLPDMSEASESFPYILIVPALGNNPIVRRWGQIDDDKVEIRDVDLSAVTRPVRRYFLRLPMAAFIKSVQFSPQADRIAWLLIDRKARHVTKVGLYVCRADGTDMKEIGSLKVNSAPYNLPGPDDLRWLPDGNRLSFIYKRTLWTVPVD
jgi:hypothetical protein